MALYSIVDEGYDVVLHRSALAAYRAVEHESFALEQFSEKAATKAEILAALRAPRAVVRLFELDARDWKYRIQRHDRRA